MSELQAILEGAREDLREVLEKYIDGMVESHLEGWKERYFMKSKERISEDLYVNHDPSLEIENVERWLGRNLEDEEIDIVETYFNESVLAEFQD